MNPILKYLRDLFPKQRILSDDSALNGLVQADILLQSLINREKVPGLSITVLKEGTLLLQKGYGFADMEHERRIDPKKTIFRIASISKNIAATALAQMVAEGKIDLDTSFYNYVSYYPKKKWDFTIRQLANHTAGIRGYRGKEYGFNEPYTIKESIKIFKDDDLVFEPGTDYLYNSYDWILISLAMEEVSGMPFEEYVAEKVLNPLGMTHTFAPELYPEIEQKVKNTNEKALATAGPMENIAIFYSKNRSGFRKAIPVNNYYKLAGGGYLSTSDDIAKFGQAYLAGKLLDENIKSQFLTSEVVNGTKTYYGLGWQVSKDSQGRPFYGHVGNAVGGYANFFVYPEQQMVFSILVNCTDPKIQDDLDKVVDILINSHFS